MTYAPPNAARNREIYAKRQAGRTLKSIAADYGLSTALIRIIVFREERRSLYPGSQLSPRARTCITNAVGSERDMKTFEYGFENPKEVAGRVAQFGWRAMLDQPICGVKTVREIEAWIAEYGFRWSDGPNLAGISGQNRALVMWLPN